MFGLSGIIEQTIKRASIKITFDKITSDYFTVDDALSLSAICLMFKRCSEKENIHKYQRS